MTRRGLTDISHRAITNYRVREELLPEGRVALIVSNLKGVVIWRIEGGSKEEAERHLRDMGIERIPSYVAFEIDQEAKGE